MRGRQGPRRGKEAQDTTQAPRGREPRAGTAWQPSRPGPGVAPEGGARSPARGAQAADPSWQNPLPRAGTDLSRARLGLAGRGLRSPSAGRRLARSPGPGRAASSPPGASEPGPGAAAAHPTAPAGPATTKGGGGARPGGGAGNGWIARARRALEGCSRRGDNAARPGWAPAAASAGGGVRRGAGPGPRGAGRGLREAGPRRGSRAARFLCAVAPPARGG